MTYQTFRSFSNIGFNSFGRSFPGFPLSNKFYNQIIAPRQALRFDLDIDDLIEFNPLGAQQSLSLLVFDHKGKNRPEYLGLKNNHHIAAGTFEDDALRGWVCANGGTHKSPFEAVKLTLTQALIFKARASCTIWAIQPVKTQKLVEEASLGLVQITLKTTTSNNIQLPPPLGKIRQEFTVKRGSARSYILNTGEMVQIIDIEGQQCSDFMALRLNPLELGHEISIDSTATRSMVRGAYPSPGLLDKFFDAELRPMLKVVQDTCGRHDTFGLACTARSYEERGFFDHLNCSDNMSEAFLPYGIKRRAAWPAVNFFWNTWIDHNSHQLQTAESYSRPGDYVVMQDLDHLVCTTTACPDDLDPINGWNPTDIHVRIYDATASIKRAIAYREKENAPMSISKESAFYPALSKLTNQFRPVRDIWLPTHFPAYGMIGEYWACRQKATLQDMSSLRKYDIIGPDSGRLLQIAMSRDIARLALWRGFYTLICDESGCVVDDGTLFRLGDELFRWCCGTEQSAFLLKKLADDKNLQVRINAMSDALPNLALQGPKSREILQKIIFTQSTLPALENLKWFGASVARIRDRDGTPFMITRSGYTGELGFELFCAKSDAPLLWDQIMSAGEEFGITPMGLDALETLRIEAGFAAAGAEIKPGVDAYESGLGFAVDLKKSSFIGKSALERNAKSPRKLLKGLKFDSNDIPAHGAVVFKGEQIIGEITSPTYSPMFECTIAMARLAIEFCQNDNIVEIGQMDGHMKKLTARICNLPFVDPMRERAQA
ncbi:MAG: DUF1989 domain-containing protein [Pseudomonadota bacterium]